MMQIVSACVIRLWMCFCCRKPKVDDEVGTPLVVSTPTDSSSQTAADGRTDVFSTPETNPDRLQTRNPNPDRLQTRNPNPDRLQTRNPKPKQGCCERVAFFFQQESTQNCFRRTAQVISNLKKFMSIKSSLSLFYCLV